MAVTVRRRGYSWDKSQETVVQEDNSTPVIRIPNIQDSLNLSDLLYIRDIPQEALKISAVTKDWILFVGSNGNPERIGDSVLISEDRPMVFASFLQGIAVKYPKEILPDYFALWMRLHNVHQTFSKTSQQTTGLSNISWGAVKKLPFRVPIDIEEQRKIVAALSYAQDAIIAAQQHLLAAQNLKSALMQQFFTKGIPGRHERYKTIKIARTQFSIPDEWELETLSAHCGGPDCVKTGPFGAQLPPDVFRPTGVRMINITDIGEGTIVFETEAYVAEEVAERLRDYRLRKGDLIFSRVASVGRMALITEEYDGFLMSSNCIRLRPNRSFNSRFLMHTFLDSLAVSRQVVAASTGGARPIVTPRFLRRMAIPKPLRDEQDEIAGIIEANSQLIFSLELRIRALVVLKKFLLQNLLTGKIRFIIEVKA